MARSLPRIIADFESAFDEVFDDLLIGPWRAPATEDEPAIVLEREDAYEVRLCTGDFQPADLEVVVNEKCLTVRGRRGLKSRERLINFGHAVQTAAVSARWSNRMLTVILPKQGAGAGQK